MIACTLEVCRFSEGFLDNGLLPFERITDPEAYEHESKQASRGNSMCIFTTRPRAVGFLLGLALGPGMIEPMSS